MRGFGIAAALLLLSCAMAMAQTSQPNDQQSTTDKAKDAASDAAGAVKSGVQTGANKTAEGAEKAYGAAKDAVTGPDSEQSGQEKDQSSTQPAEPTDAKGSSRRLPQTASPLPFLGLLGLGTFSAGAWKSRLFSK